jgi:hypothetical protein
LFLSSGETTGRSCAAGWTDYQKLAQNATWNWKGEHASLLYSVTEHFGDYQTEIICPPGPNNLGHTLTFRVLENGQEVYKLAAARNTVFTRNRDTLFIAEPMRGGTGCWVTAVDFKTNTQIWKRRLDSKTNRPHSVYQNNVTIEHNSEALIVLGNETLLHYIEYVDMKTGKTLAQREFPLK